MNQQKVLANLKSLNQVIDRRLSIKKKPNTKENIPLQS